MPASATYSSDDIGTKTSTASPGRMPLRASVAATCEAARSKAENETRRSRPDERSMIAAVSGVRAACSRRIVATFTTPC